MGRPAIEEELREEGLTDEELTDRENSMAARIRYVGPNVVHVEPWRRIEGGGIYFSQEASQAATDTMPDSWNFILGLREAGLPVAILLESHDLGDWNGLIYRRFFRGTPAVEMRVISGAGHNAWIDRSFEFTTRVHEDLERIRAVGNGDVSNGNP